MEQNKKYKLRAISSKVQVYTGAVILGVLISFFFILLNELFPHKRVYVSVNCKIALISTFLSSLLLLIINQFFISSKITIGLTNNKILLYFRNRIESININDIKEINFTQLNKFNKTTFLVIKIKEKELNICTGFLFTFPYESKNLKNIYITHLKEYLLSNSFTDKKILIKNGFKERLLPNHYKNN